MMRSVLSALASLTMTIVHAQVTFLVTETPQHTPEDATLYISGDFDGWTGGSQVYSLTKVSEGYAITLDQMSGTINYKLTLGSWQSVEKGADGEEVDNRSYTFGGNGDTVQIQISSWAETQDGSTAVENVMILDEAFYMPQLERTRRIWVYLPPGYDEDDTSYPVLYLHDAQNCFDETTAFACEWEVDETLNRLAEAGELELIVIGIENGGANRIDEYSPWNNEQYGGGNGEAYVAFLTETLKPHIDTTFRTKPEAYNTAILGSSLGGLISHYAALTKPQVFGKAGVFSPSLWFVADSVYSFGHGHGRAQDLRMYFLAGELEGEDVPGDVRRMIDTMSAGGFPIENIALVVDAHGQHTEEFWRRKFEEAVMWLFLDTPVKTQVHNSGDYELIRKVYPNAALDTVVVEFNDSATYYSLQLKDPTGHVIRDQKGRAEIRLDVRDLGPGLYTLEASDGKDFSRKKLLLN